MDINVKGAIINNDEKWFYDWLEMDSCCPRDVSTALQEAAGQRVDVYINSGGGSLFAGVEIYNTLRHYQGPVLIHVVGLAASAASVIMCAGRSEIEPTAMVMIHNASRYLSGGFNYLDLDREREALRKASSAVCAAYVAKTGRPEAELQALMDQEKWFTAQEAVDLGLVDAVADTGTQMVASVAPVVPEEVMARVKDKLAEERKNGIAMGRAMARLERLEEATE